MRYILNSLGNLIVRIYVIGYNKQGESIIILLKDHNKDSIIYSIVIDCFMKKNCNRTIDILKHEKVSHLDILCWSHPDNDHSWGLHEILNKSFCNNKTKFISPYGIETSNMLFDNYNKYQYNYLNLIENLIRSSQIDHVVQTVSPRGHNCVDTIELSDNLNTINVEIITLSPFSSVLQNKYCDNTLFKKNDFSIVLSLNVGAYKFVFTSDIENENIAFLNSSQFKKPLIIKIPHHGSYSSKHLVENLLETDDKKNTVAFTTRFSAQNLPRQELLELYKLKCCQVDYTGEGNKNEYGIIRYDVDLYNTLTMKSSYLGNAHKV